MEVIDNNKEFHSFEELEKEVFPNAWKKKQKELLKKKMGYGKYLAYKFFKKLRKGLENV